MFLQLFRYRLKCLLRDRLLIFWTLVFPIILGSFFYMAFMNLSNDETFTPINTALVTSSHAAALPFEQTVVQLSKGKNRLFNLRKTASSAQAERWLRKGTVTGYFTANQTIRLHVSETGISQSIMRTFADDYVRSRAAYISIVKNNPDAVRNGLLQALSHLKSQIKTVQTGGAKPNIVLNYFYSLIAMACLYGSFWGNKEIVDTQANLSARAARFNLAPIHKLRIFLAGCCADLLIIYAELLALIAYLHFILHVDFGSRIGYVLITALVGAMLGLSFGTFVSAAVKKSENMKFAILIAVTMTGCFLSGMMISNMKYLVSVYAPPLAWINPANLLTDAFYSLYYYDSLHRYFVNLEMMGLFIILFCIGTYLMIRRRKYATL